MLRNPKYLYGDSILNVPSHLNFPKYMLEVLWSHEDKIALINGHTHEKLSYRDLAKDSMNVAISLARMGVVKGDTIAICSENRQEYFSALIGIMCTGAIATATNVACTKGELEHLLGISTPKIIFCSPHAFKNHATTFKTLPYIKTVVLFGKERSNDALRYEDLAKPATGGNDIALEKFDVVDVAGQTDTAVILYSSGTTGLPKGVMLTHLNIISTCNLPTSLNPNALSLFVTPWYHTMGMMGTFRLFSSGATLVYLSKFDTDFYMQTIQTYKIVQLTVAPPVLVALCKSRASYDISTVRFVYSGAAPLKEDTVKAVKLRFPNVLAVSQGYGMTESTLAVTRNSHFDILNNAVRGVGRIVAGSILKIVDIKTRNVLGPNQSGEVCFKGPTIMKGYVGKDSSDDFDEEGFFKTGDVAYYDDDQYVFIVDRLKELIKYKGYQVAPAEIEAVLLEHPGIRDAAVVGVPNESAGEVPRAFIVLQSGSGLSEDDIKQFVAGKLSNPKHIRGGVRFVNEIPKNPSGKILRKQLRELVETKSKL